MERFRTRLSSAVVVVFTLVAAGCTSRRVMLIHPQTGATAECDASGSGSLSLVVDAVVDECVKRVEKQGYVPVEKLTPEQRADLDRRGIKVGAQ